MAAHNELGKWGEDIATNYLLEKGYRIIERDWKSGHRDIDIIAMDGDVLVFFEVKTRQNCLFGSPEESIDYKKRKNLQAAFNHYIKYRHVDNEIRYDIITVVGAIGTKPEINHIVDVWL